MPRFNLDSEERYDLYPVVKPDGEFEISEGTLERWNKARIAYEETLTEMATFVEARTEREALAAQEKNAEAEIEAERIVKECFG